MPGIVGKVGRYIFENEALAEALETFAREHCTEVEDEKEDGMGYKFEYTTLHKRYQRLLEGSIASFIESQGSSIDEFYEEMKSADDDSDEAIIGHLLLGAADFEVFLQMMRDVKAQVADESRRGK